MEADKSQSGSRRLKMIASHRVTRAGMFGGQQREALVSSSATDRVVVTQISAERLIMNWVLAAALCLPMIIIVGVELARPDLYDPPSHRDASAAFVGALLFPLLSFNLARDAYRLLFADGVGAYVLGDRLVGVSPGYSSAQLEAIVWAAPGPTNKVMSRPIRLELMMNTGAIRALPLASTSTDAPEALERLAALGVPVRTREEVARQRDRSGLWR